MDNICGEVENIDNNLYIFFKVLLIFLGNELLSLSRFCY